MRGAPVDLLAVLAISGTGTTLLLIGAAVAGIFTGLSLRRWRERRRK